MRRLLLLATVFSSLLSCAPQPSPYEARRFPPPPGPALDTSLPPRPPPRTMAAAPHTYRGQGDGGALEVTINPVASGFVQVHAEIGGHFCAGSFDGAGRVQGNRIVATSSDPDSSQCQMTFVTNGNRLSVRPNTACLSLSGASCGFIGTATLVR